MDIRQNFNQILPIMSIISSGSIDEVTDENYQLSIGKEEELVARFLKAYENGTINRCLVEYTNGLEEPVDFDELVDADDECRQHIYNCMDTYARKSPRNKIYEISFIKFLFRRIRFFTGHFYRFNMIRNLGSITMTQMIHEAAKLAQIDFRCNDYLSVYLVYDPNFSLQLLYNDWNKVSDDLKKLFNFIEPKLNTEFQNKEYLALCLSWLIDIPCETFVKIMDDTKFILTESFAYKLFHIHERKLTKLSLIIEGETGVGKTFLLTFYSLLLNANIINGSLQGNIAPRIRERTSSWLWSNVFIDILDNESALLSTIVRQINRKLKNLTNDDQETRQAAATIVAPLAFDAESDMETDTSDDEEYPFGRPSETQLVNTDRTQLDDTINPQEIEVMPFPSLIPQFIPRHRLKDPIDVQILNEIQHSLHNCKYDNDILRYIWKTIITVASENQMSIAEKLNLELHNYVTSQFLTLPLIEASYSLKNLLNESHSSTIQGSIRMFNEYLCHTQVKPVFYRLLLHPGVSEEQLEDFMTPIIHLAAELTDIELVVFFDEINTSSCLGLFKEMFMDRTLHGKNLPQNIFFTAAINPALISVSDDNLIHRPDYVVHQLPQALEGLIVPYGILESKTLLDYIKKKIAIFTVHSSNTPSTRMPLEKFVQDTLAQSIMIAQEFCEKRLGNLRRALSSHA
jgi:hypothetical protein